MKTLLCIIGVTIAALLTALFGIELIKKEK